MPRSVKQNEQMRAATRTAIMNSAMMLFAQNGYAHTTTRRIATEAEISTGLMYHYFSSKEELLRAVFDNSMAILGEAFATAYDGSEPRERLPNLLRTMFEMLAREEPFWSLFYMLRSQPAVMHVVGDAFRMWTRRLRELFEVELQGAGWPNPQMEALILYSLVEGTIQQYLMDPAAYPLERVAAHIVDEYNTQSKEQRR